MPTQDVLAEEFEQNRARMHAVAYRMLGSPGEAEDAVQEAWLRLSRSSAEGIDNVGGWLTTVVARVSLDMLRARGSRREESLEIHEAAPSLPGSDAGDPEQQALLADSIGPAMLLVLDTLPPAERLAFVLHDMFGVSFAEIAPIVGRSPEAARQLASRGRRRVRGAATSATDSGRQRAVVEAFLAAAREGDFAALMNLLDPDAAMRADAAAVALGSPAEVRGARAVAEMFSGRARVAKLALIDGAPGAAWAPGGKPRVAFAFTLRNGVVVAIDLLAEEERLERAGVVVLET